MLRNYNVYSWCLEHLLLWTNSSIYVVGCFQLRVFFFREIRTDVSTIAMFVDQEQVTLLMSNWKYFSTLIKLIGTISESSWKSTCINLANLLKWKTDKKKKDHSQLIPLQRILSLGLRLFFPWRWHSWGIVWLFDENLVMVVTSPGVLQLQMVKRKEQVSDVIQAPSKQISSDEILWTTDELHCGDRTDQQALSHAWGWCMWCILVSFAQSFEQCSSSP